MTIAFHVRLLAGLMGLALTVSGASGQSVSPSVPAVPSSQPAASAPGDAFLPPIPPATAAGPRIFEYSADAGPDQTFFMVGDGLADVEVHVWGASAGNSAGQEWKPKVQFRTASYLAATLPERCPDGIFAVWVQSRAGVSHPIILNAPQPWWCGPDVAAPGELVRIFGRNLSRRPDFSAAFVYLAAAGKPGVWCEVVKSGKYDIAFRVPAELTPGDYEVRVHAGQGGNWGWSAPVSLRVVAAAKPSAETVTLDAAVGGDEIQVTMDKLAHKGGGVLLLGRGTFTFHGTLRIPADVTLRGVDRNATTLQLAFSGNGQFAGLGARGWSLSPGKMHTVGDMMEYELTVPKGGQWNVFLRYATDLTPWKQPGCSGNHGLSLDDGNFMMLDNLPNTGGFGTYRWSKCAAMNLPQGKHKLTWKNIKGGGISLDAMVFTLDPAYAPSDSPLPVAGENVIVLQAEDCVKMQAKEGELPGGERAAVWLAGDGASLADLTLLGNAQVQTGVAIRSREQTQWVSRCRVERVTVADIDGKQGENAGLHVRNVDRAIVRDCQFTGRVPLFISGARKSEFARNRLVSVTRFGGNAEAVILGRCEPIEECVVEENVIATPAGAESGSPTARRLIWFSTGHGSVTHNWLAKNGVEKPAGPGADSGAAQARFGGTAGTDQNVGEMILFEGNHRTAYFGRLDGADARSVMLPKTLASTPEDRLGNVKRDVLAHDASGAETPFYPPHVDDGTDEPPMGEYYVTIFSGAGQGQTRRVLKRDGQRLVLDQPWRVLPDGNSVATVGTAFYQNLIVGNYTPDGMTGIQLWISCMENVISGNTIARQRKPGLFLYANGTTLASSMPRTWNRGISPLFWNHVEGNRTDECSDGALVTSGDSPSLPVEFPRAMGNVLRHNSFVRNRGTGVIVASRKASPTVADTSAAIVGTIVEFNVVRDATTAYHSGETSNQVVFRRDHAYFWNPVGGIANPVAFQIDRADADAAVELNSVEGKGGDLEKYIIEIKRPAGVEDRKNTSPTPSKTTPKK